MKAELCFTCICDTKLACFFFFTESLLFSICLSFGLQSSNLCADFPASCLVDVHFPPFTFFTGGFAALTSCTSTEAFCAAVCFLYLWKKIGGFIVSRSIFEKFCCYQFIFRVIAFFYCKPNDQLKRPIN